MAGIRSTALWGLLGWALERIPSATSLEPLRIALDTQLRAEAAAVDTTAFGEINGVPVEVQPAGTMKVGFLGPTTVQDDYATASLSGTTPHYYVCPAGKRAFVYRIHIGIVDGLSSAGSPFCYGGVAVTPGSTPGLQVAVVDASNVVLRYVYKDVPGNYALQAMFPNFQAHYANNVNVVSGGETFSQPIVLEAGQKLRAKMQTSTAVSANLISIAYVEVDA